VFCEAESAVHWYSRVVQLTLTYSDTIDGVLDCRGSALDLSGFGIRLVVLAGSLLEPLARRGRITHLAVPDNVQQANDIGSACQILQNLDFPLDLLLLDRLEYFDNTLLICRQVYRLEYLQGEGMVSASSLLRAHYSTKANDLPRSISLFRPFGRSHSCPEYPTARPGCLSKEADMSIDGLAF
jgi:hypothetical protein